VVSRSAQGRLGRREDGARSPDGRDCRRRWGGDQVGIRQRGRLWHKRALIVSSDLEIVSYFGDVHGHAASRVRLRLRCSELLRCTPVSLDVASRC